MTLFDGWLLKKANPDAERNHLNKILQAIRSAIDAVIATVVNTHNDLGGLQGGTSGEYYHLTSAEHAKVQALPASSQPLDATLTALAAQNWVLNAMPLGTGADTVTQLALAANTFPGRSSAGNVAAKPITDDALLLLADSDVPRLGTTNTWTAAQTFTSDIMMSGAAWRMVQDTADGSDTGRFAAAGGGVPSAARGAYLIAHGNENATFPGQLQLVAGTGADIVITASSGGIVRPSADNVPMLGSASFRYAGIHTVGTNNYGAEYQTGEQAVALTANTDNQTVNSTTRVIRITSNGAYNLTGLTGGGADRRLTILNTSAFTITLTHDATSTAANRFLCPNNANFAIRQNGAAEVIYDSTSSRYRVIGA